MAGETNAVKGVCPVPFKGRDPAGLASIPGKSHKTKISVPLAGSGNCQIRQGFFVEWESALSPI